MQQILNWSPCLPTPGACSSPSGGSRRSHSTESPVKPKVATNVRRQLFKSSSHSSSTNQRASSVVPVDRSLIFSSSSSRGRTLGVNSSDTNVCEEEVSSSVLNPEKYKTMHCRNFLAKGWSVNIVQVQSRRNIVTYSRLQCSICPFWYFTK